MQEKRKVERFDLQIETMLHVHGAAEDVRHMRVRSRDVSSAGVFLLTETPLPLGTTVDLILSINNELAGRQEPNTLNLKNSGRVIRTSRQGMAIQFMKKTQLIPL